MRIAPALLLASVGLLGYAASPTQQTEPLAEQQFKNIQSFKGNKATDVIPAMEFMSASLKVECDYCHTQDQSSDAKDEKKIARDMIAMQRDINAKYFHGRNEVTCATCHGGRTHPLSVPPIPGLEVRAQRSQEVKPEDVVAQFAKAAGQAPLTGLRLSGKSTRKGETTPVDATYAGEKFLVVTHTAKGDVKLGYNGRQVWYAAPGFSTVIPSEVAERFRNQNALYLTAGSLPKLRNASAGTAKVGAKDALTIGGLFGEGAARASLFVDKKSGRLLRTSYSYPTVLGAMVEINEFDGYRKVGAIQVPMNVTLHTADADEVRKFTFAKEDARIDPALFDPPK